MALITLIDDEEISNFLNRKMIESVNPDFEVEEFLSSRDALESLKKRPIGQLPDIILLDIRMPEMNGFELIEDLLKSEREDMIAIKIIIMTSSLYHKDKSKALSYPNVIDFINKPITEEHISNFKNYL